MPESYRTARLILPPGDTDRTLAEAEDRGYLSHVLVEVADDHYYPVFFFTTSRLQFELETSSKLGQPYLAETGMIILKELTLEAMELSIRALLKEGYFDYQVPLTRERISKADPYQWPP